MVLSGLLAVLLALGGVAPDELIAEGFRLLRAHDTRKAEQAFEAAIKEAERQNNSCASAEAHRGLARVFSTRAEYPAAIREFEKSLALFESIPDSLGAARARTGLGAVVAVSGETARARALFEKAIAEFDALQAWHEKAHVLYAFSFAFLFSDDQSTALRAQALDIARRVGDKQLEGQILHVQGDIAFGRGDFAQALEKLESASTLLEQTDADVEFARVLISLGRLYRTHGQADRALPLYSRALKIQEKTDDKQGTIQTLNAMGVAYAALDQKGSSLEQYQKALTLALETGSPRLINFQRGGLATALASSGRHAESIELLLQVLSQPIEPWLAAYRYGNLGAAYYGCGLYAQAVTACDRAADYAGKTENSDALLTALWWRAQAAVKLGWEPEALADARERMDEIERLRAKLVPADFMKRGFNEQFQASFAFAIDLQYRSGEIENALLDAERARGRAFLDLMASRNVKVKSSNPEKLSLLTRGQRSELQLSSLVSAEPPSIEQIGAIARRLKSTVLIYWVGEERTFIWVIKPDGSLRSKSVAVKASRLDELVRDSWGTAEGTASRGFTLPLRSGDSIVLVASEKNAWRELHRLLIKPVREFLPAKQDSLLTIIPHGPLFRLSFAALLDERGRYLLENYTVHSAPALSVVQFLGDGNRALSKSGQKYLLVSNPRFSDSEMKLAALPGSEREVESIAQLLPPNAVTVLSGERASEEGVRRSAAGAGVLHFATHGIVRDDQVLDSFLALTGGEKSAANNGRLTAQEVYELDLDADLVVLSACRSGRGKVSGDGVAGLTRAFFYAGASSVLATLWDVADEPTSQLLRDFYQSFNTRRDKSRALRQAQLSLLRRLRDGEVTVETPAGRAILPEHPVFWASFVLQGQP